MKLEIKVFFHKIFALFVNLYSIFPLKDNRYCFIMTHDISEYGNVGSLKKYILENEKNIEFIDIVRNDYSIKLNLKQIFVLFNFFVIKSYWFATSKYIFLDNVFLPLAHCNLQDEVKVIQLWHGCNAIKKFGQSYNTGLLKELEKKVSEKYTYLVLNSECTREKYKEAFGINDSQIIITGSPRVDIFFDKEKCNLLRKEFYDKNEYLSNKKIILYAPTFRENNDKDILEDLYILIDSLEDDFILMVRLHPSLNKHIDIKENYEDKIINMSDFSNLVQLMTVSDILITDYSSIVYEYSILEKPIILYSYDLEEFERGFYEDYKSVFLNLICYSLEEVIRSINLLKFDLDIINEIKYQNYDYQDGKNKERLINDIK